jgi:hypothetical protein
MVVELRQNTVWLSRDLHLLD